MSLFQAVSMPDNLFSLDAAMQASYLVASPVEQVTGEVCPRVRDGQDYDSQGLTPDFGFFFSLS